jgi:hypothetical protein
MLPPRPLGGEGWGELGSHLESHLTRLAMLATFSP